MNKYDPKYKLSYKPRGFTSYSYVVLLSTLLTACGGSDNDGSSVIEPDPVPPVASSISTTDIRMFGTQNQVTKIDVRQGIESESQTEVIYVDDVKALSTQPSCSDYSINDQVIEITGQEIGSCVYQYTVMNAKETEQASGVIQLAVVSNTSMPSPYITQDAGSEYQLPPLSAPIQIGDPDLTIDLQSELGEDFPAGAQLDEAPVLVGAEGDSFSYDVANGTITLPSNRAFGYSRIFYSLSVGEDVYLGAIDISVSNAANHAPIADNIVWENDVKLAETVSVDLTTYVSDVDGMAGLSLFDVSGYNATIAITGDLTFDVTPNMQGVMTLGYVISDNQGGFILGQLTMNVVSPYSPITLSAGYLKPPFTYEEVLNKALNYNDVFYGEEDEIPLFTWSIGESICMAFGGRLPTPDELTEAYNQEGSNIDLLYQWPVEMSYMTDEVTFSANSVYLVTSVDLSSGEEGTFYRGSADTTAESRALTCFFEN